MIIRSERATYRAIRQRLMARASTLALRVALRPRGWASGLLMAGLIGAPAAALAQETMLTTDAELTIQGGAPYDSSGTVSGAGDVNGDGIDDLIIGAFGASPRGRSRAGAGYMVFGAADSLPPEIDLATDADLVIQGGAAGDYAGSSVSGAGDVNGDGIDDLIIGAPRAAPNGRHDAGASYVVFGAQDLSGTVDLARGADLVIRGAVDQLSGNSVSGAGDVNGDGIDDLIIGAYHASPRGRTRAGASYVVFGNADGLPAIINLARDADLIIQGAGADDLSGYSVSGAGDVDGDGIDDLIIGAITASPRGRRAAGASYVVLGAVELAGTVDLADPVNGADLIIQGGRTDDLSGSSVSGAGDVNADGIDDLLIGSSDAALGAAYVVFGNPDGLPPTIDLATEADVTIRGTTTNDQFGRVVSGAGDVNGDGVNDLLIGAPFPGPHLIRPGVGYVVPGATGLAGTIDVADPANGAALIIQAAPFAFTVFSDIAVSGAGDVNGDGIGDLVVGATSANPHDRVFAGASYVVFGGPAAALERLIAEVDAADLPRRLENRLTRNLENALEDVTDNKISRAILRLRTFVGKVKAQRGKKIDKAVADDWIADAEAIIDTLKAQRRQRAPQNRTLGSMAGAP